MKSNPLIIGHRGASGSAPENTLKAFQLAYTQGADGIELDIFLTKDKNLVVTHDENLERLTGTPVLTRQLTLKALRTLDFGEGEKIPTLAEVFDAFKNKFQIINVEIKSTGWFSDGIEGHLVRLVEKFGMAEQILVSSFNPLHVYRMKNLAPAIKRGYLLAPENHLVHFNSLIKACNVTSINCDHQWLTKKQLHKFKEQGKDIWLWTVNEEEDMKKWQTQHIAAIITNYPAKLKHIYSNNFS